MFISSLHNIKYKNIKISKINKKSFGKKMKEIEFAVDAFGQ
jgi:hypothetical protein